MPRGCRLQERLTGQLCLLRVAHKVTKSFRVYSNAFIEGRISSHHPSQHIESVRLCCLLVHAISVIPFTIGVGWLDLVQVGWLGLLQIGVAGSH